MSGIVALAATAAVVYTAGVLEPAMVEAGWIANVGRPAWTSNVLEPLVSLRGVKAAIVLTTFTAEMTWFKFADGGSISREDWFVLVAEAALAPSLATSAVGFLEARETLALDIGLAEEFEQHALRQAQAIYPTAAHLARELLAEEVGLDAAGLTDEQAINEMRNAMGQARALNREGIEINNQINDLFRGW